MKRMKDMFHKFQQASETRPSVASLPAMPATEAALQQELQRIVGPVVFSFLSQAKELQRLGPADENEDQLVAGTRTPARREGGISQLVASPQAVGTPAPRTPVPAMAASPEAPGAEQVVALQDESLETENAATPVETRAVRASLLGTLDGEDDEDEPVADEVIKKTKEAKAMEGIAAVRQLFLLQKQTLWQMRTDVKVLELSSGSLRPGYLLSKLQGARTQAQKLGDAILIGNVDAELKEMKTMVEVVGIWKKVKALDQLLKKNWPQFLESMDKLRRHKALVAVIPWTAVANEQSVKACEAIEAGREGEGLTFLHIGNLKTHSPSLKLCTPTDLEDLQMRMV